MWRNVSVGLLRPIPWQFPTRTISHPTISHDNFPLRQNPTRQFTTQTYSHHDKFPPRHNPTMTKSHSDITPLRQIPTFYLRQNPTRQIQTFFTAWKSASIGNHWYLKMLIFLWKNRRQPLTALLPSELYFGGSPLHFLLIVDCWGWSIIICGVTKYRRLKSYILKPASGQ